MCDSTLKKRFPRLVTKTLRQKFLEKNRECRAYTTGNREENRRVDERVMDSEFTHGLVRSQNCEGPTMQKREVKQ